MNAQQLAENRYTCKAYDKDFIIDTDTLNRILEALRLAPSSINIQPWQFLVAVSPESKQQLASFAYDMNAYNQPKIANAAAVIVFAAKTSISHQDIADVMATEFSAGRFADESTKNTRTTYIQNYLDTKPKAQITTWLENQVYLAVGTLLILAQVEGLDATPIEGFDTALCDKVLALDTQGYHSLVMVALGQRSNDDFNAKLPKSRFESAQVIRFL